MDSAQIFITICMFLSFAVIWTSLAALYKGLRQLNMKLDVLVSLSIAEKIGDGVKGVEIKEVKEGD